jgi:hypothetical protein
MDGAGTLGVHPQSLIMVRRMLIFEGMAKNPAVIIS